MPFSNFLFLLFFFAAPAALSQHVNALEPDAFQRAMRSLDSPQLIDLRSLQEFDRGHIRKAICLPYLDDNFKENVLQSFSTHEPLFLYCFTGEMSRNASIFLQDLGFEYIIYLDGGFSQWTSTSKPYVSSSVSAAPIAAFSMENLWSFVAKNSRVLLFIDKPNCPTCTALEHVLRANTGRTNYTRLLKVDGEKDLEISEHFKPTAWPTMVLFENGKQVWRNSGDIETARLLKILYP
ncbi:hypothetical protein LAG90_04030 [Marinilongibacter aquaticus]|uniref:rhodanese-like domain-containing protein n=1 Tax=Marinilongibacter aquaticus TaxID=2975157 RepID=UPI0021BD991A|nr:rhodanese-like domain-containing protein [Marinilongibacter aquaticus]UBM59815.1 hypothetical protein LAG90_04030 [Marinilongibacter aquaticus]